MIGKNVQIVLTLFQLCYAIPKLNFYKMFSLFNFLKTIPYATFICLCYVYSYIFLFCRSYQLKRHLSLFRSSAKLTIYTTKLKFYRLFLIVKDCTSALMEKQWRRNWKSWHINLAAYKFGNCFFLIFRLASANSIEFVAKQKNQPTS